MSQAAGTKARMAVGLGPKVDLGDGIEHAFPGPSRLVGLERFPGLTETKAERLRHLARTAVGAGWRRMSCVPSPSRRRSRGSASCPASGPSRRS